MACSGADRRRGAFDALDGVLGVVLAVGLPFLTQIVLVSAGVKTESELGLFQESVEVPPPPPDQEEVDAKLTYFRALWVDGARPFLERALHSRGNQQLREMRWAFLCLHGVKKDLTSVESLIRSTGVESRFGSRLAEIRRIVAEVDKGIASLHALDRFGILGTPAD